MPFTMMEKKKDGESDSAMVVNASDVEEHEDASNQIEKEEKKAEEEEEKEEKEKEQGENYLDTNQEQTKTMENMSELTSTNETQEEEKEKQEEKEEEKEEKKEEDEKNKKKILEFHFHVGVPRIEKKAKTSINYLTAAVAKGEEGEEGGGAQQEHPVERQRITLVDLSAGESFQFFL